jgi:retinol dehydrogenase 12
MAPPIEQMTADGYDLQFGTNVLGHAIFTIQLLPVLIAGARSSADKKARVVNTSSSGAYASGGNIDLSAYRDKGKREQIGKWNLYFHSKLVCYLTKGRTTTDQIDRETQSFRVNSLDDMEHKGSYRRP